MDRRSIIFILGMTVFLFLVNQWFEYGKKESYQVEEAQTRVEFLSGQMPPPLSQAQREEFGIVPLYLDLELREFFSYAIKRDDNLLTIFEIVTKAPDTLYMPSLVGDTKLSERVDLRVSPKKVGDPALYSIYPLSKLTIPSIPKTGEYPVQMLLFEGEDIRVIDGTTYGVDRAIFDTLVDTSALILFDHKGVKSPYGYFDKEKKLIRYLASNPQLENFSYITFPIKEAADQRDQREKFYVLENAYFQLVFSNLNGALAEINLPFASEENTHSVVRPIQFDAILRRDYPENDMFPQHLAVKATADGKTQQLTPKIGGYYPLIRRSLIGNVGDTTVKVNPHLYTAAVFERDAFPFVQEFEVTRFEPRLIEFQSSNGKRKITKTFSISENSEDAPYCLDMSIDIQGDARGLLVGSGVPEVELISGAFNPTFKYRQRNSIKPKIEQIKTPKGPIDLSYVDMDWFCNGNGFFGIIIDPLNRETQGLGVDPILGERIPSRLTVIEAQFKRFPSEKYSGYQMMTPILARPGTTNYRLFLGPFDKSILKRVDRHYTDPVTGYNPDYSGAQSYHGWFAFISQPFARFLFLIMDFFHAITHSWGISIILLTVTLRLMLYPLNNWSMRSNAKLQKLAPKIREIQDKYKKDPKRVQLEMMSFYRKEKVNPLGGCFPILIQLPFLFGMFDLLKSSFELRGAIFIPGWIDNLTAPDVLFSWDYPFPFFGNALHLLPILLGVIMFVQQKVMSGSGVATGQQRQQRAMGNIMTIVFTVMFYHFPSGLNLYWISSMLLGILQQWYVNLKMKSAKG